MNVEASNVLLFSLSFTYAYARSSGGVDERRSSAEVSGEGCS